MKTYHNKFSLILFIFSILSFSTYAGNYSWTGATSVSWSNSANWSPAGVPSTNDSVTISNQTNSPELSVNTTVKKFTINSDTLDLKTHTLTISTYGNFNGGTISNGLLYNTAATTVVFAGTTFDAKVKMTAGTISLNGSVFNDSLSLYKSGKSNISSIGGNTFNGPVYYENPVRANIVFSDSLPDIFNSTFYFNNLDTGAIYIAHRGTGNQFNGDVKVKGKKFYFNYYGTATFSGNIHLSCPAGEIYFGYSSGSSTLVSGKNLVLDTAIGGNLYFRNFTKSGTDSLNFGNPAQLYFESGCVFHGKIIATSTIHLDGARFLGPVYFTNEAYSNVTSLGGCYFGDKTTIINHGSWTATVSLGATVADTFQSATSIHNERGYLSINNADFNDSITFLNDDTSSTSNSFSISNTGVTRFYGALMIGNNISGMEFGDAGVAYLEETGTINTVNNPTGNIIIKHFIQQGSTPQSFYMPLSNSKLFLVGNNTFNGNFTFLGQNIEVGQSTFNGTFTVTKYGSSDMTWYGGNVFNSTVTIKDSSTSSHYLKLGNTMNDYYNGNSTFIEKGAGSLYPAYNTTSYFRGNITVDGVSSISFCANNGRVIIDGSSSQSINKSSSYIPLFKKITINKSNGALTLNTPVNISDELVFQKGIINSDSANLISLSNGGVISGASDTSFVNGPFKKIGNAAFVFPIGYNSFYTYRPIEMTPPSSSTDAYTAQYLHEAQTLGTPLDTSIEHLNTCEYWKLTRNVGSSKVRIKINWNNDNCDFVNPLYMRIAGWDGSLWKDLISYAYSGDSIKGSVTSLDSVTSMSVFTTALKRCIYFKDVITKYDVKCHGGTDGMAHVTVSKGTPPYTYSWSNSMGTQPNTPPILFANQYKVVISDLLGCQLTDSTIITEPDSLVTSFTKTSSSCGNSTGTATVSVTGGAGGSKSYYWTLDGSTSSVHENLFAGEYTVLASDSNGCSVYSTVQISDSDGPEINLSNMTPASCYGGKDGGATIEITSGNDPYKINWSSADFDTLTEVTDLRGGFYSVNVTDSDGCLSFETVEITQPSTFDISVSIENTHCGAHEGTATAEVTGGTSPYHYLWSSSSSSTDNISSLNSGKDTVTVTDNNGCILKKEFQILDIGGIILASHVITNETCFLDSSGSARVSVTGGTSPYSFVWFPRGGDNDTAFNLITDDYLVTVTDHNGCKQQTNLSIHSPEPIRVFSLAFPASDDSSSNSKEIAIPYGGTPPYSYLWSTGSTLSEISGTPGGDTVTVIDSHSCLFKSDPYPRQRLPRACGYTNFHGECSVSAVSCTTPCNTYTIDITASPFGANGTDNLSDECAFEKAILSLSSVSTSVIKTLYIPAGTYDIGYQDVGGLFWLTGHSVIDFSNNSHINIVGDINAQGEPTSILRLNKCMRFGAFNPTTGDRYITQYWRNVNPSCTNNVLGPSNYSLCAEIENMMNFHNCYDVNIQNIELDGNIEKTIIGGGYTDGIQLGYSGIRLRSTRGVKLENVRVHHFGLDGIWITDECTTVPPNSNLNFFILNIIINNCKFYYNARNNMTWGSGADIKVYNSDFNDAGQSRFGSPMEAGLDIEYEGGLPNRKGYFYKCHFDYNRMYGMISDNHVSNDFRFESCSFIGPFIAAFINARKFVFNNCYFVGETDVHYDASYSSYFNFDQTKFNLCKFNEEHVVPNVGRRSFQWSADEVNGGCPMPTHLFMLNILGGRHEFHTCEVHTNFTLKNAYVYGGAPNWNHIYLQYTGFYNHGLNGCACDNVLSAISNTTFIGNWNGQSVTQCPGMGPLQPRNQTGGCTNCCPLQYFGVCNIGITNALGFVPQYCLPCCTCMSLVTQYQHPPDPLPVTDLITYSPCTITTSAGIQTFCFPTERIRSTLTQTNKNNIEFSVRPNPVLNILFIDNIVENDDLIITNSFGERVFYKKTNGSSLQIDVNMLKPGIYFITNGKSVYKKFVKL